MSDELPSTGLSLEIRSEDARTFGPCDCCGNMTSRVWGYVYRDGDALASYFVEWTPGHAQRSANFDLVLGRWGGASEAERYTIALEYRWLETGPAFRVIDAGERKMVSRGLAARGLARSEVIGTPLATETFAICDCIYLEDPRLAELRGA